MKIIPVDSGTVVLAVGHNPTILHPSFLKAQGIVGQEWEVTGDVITTPAVSIVKFKNGVRFTVEPNKFQVLDVADHEKIGESRVAEYATAYLKALPHVTYTAVGLNFTALLECEHPSEVLTQCLLRDGPWTEGRPGLFRPGIKLAYSTETGSTLNITLDVGQTRLLSESKEHIGISIHGNYHTDLAKPSLEAALAAIDEYSNCARDFESFVELLTTGLTESIKS